MLFDERRQAAKQAIRSECAEAWPTAEAIVRFLEFARRRCAELEVLDFRNFKRLGVSYRPSELVLVLHDLCANLEGRILKVRNTGICPQPKFATFEIVRL
ncbi:MAG TPA: hypothetical protein VNH84_05820 [Candidatus Saccharimonadales bacterium]|nr:hypothetical protein [Candidatus Saccharimonadales bacterium]